MTEPEFLSTPLPPERPWFQFSLRTLLLVFVVMASSLSVFGAWGILAFGIAVAVAICLHFFSPANGIGCLGLVAFCLMCSLTFPAFESAKYAGRDALCRNQLNQIASALQAYHKEHGRFPPAYVADKSGKPLYSWRVLILPYMEYSSLCKAWHFNESWDGPNNKKLSSCVLPGYMCPADPGTRGASRGQTSYVAVVGPNAAWPGGESKNLDDFAGTKADTVMVIEAANSGIAWSEPRDLSLDTLATSGSGASAIVPSSGHGPHSGFFYTYDSDPSANAVMADGEVRYLPPGSLSPERLSTVLQIGGCKGMEVDSAGNYAVSRGHENWPNIAALAVWLVSVAGLLVRAVRSRKRLSPPPATHVA